MNQPRVNIYGFPHKALRSALSQLSLLAGKTNYSDATSLQALKDQNQVSMTLLDTHLHSEEEFLLPALEAKVKGSVQENMEEHVMLVKLEESFNALLESITVDATPDKGAAYYAAISNFHSKYLAHMEMEEQEMNPLIWANFTDEELLGIHGQIMASLSPEHSMLWFKYIVPSLNPTERSVILGGLKANAPQPAFNAVIHMLKSELTEQEHSDMMEVLNA